MPQAAPFALSPHGQAASPCARWHHGHLQAAQPRVGSLFWGHSFPEWCQSCRPWEGQQSSPPGTPRCAEGLAQLLGDGNASYQSTEQTAHKRRSGEENAGPSPLSSITGGGGLSGTPPAPLCAFHHLQKEPVGCARGLPLLSSRSKVMQVLGMETRHDGSMLGGSCHPPGAQ